MFFPLKVCELNNKDAKIFSKYFTESNGKFYFEGCWLRNQRPENAKTSGYIDETTRRRRYIHFYDTYCLIKENNKNYLSICDSYMYISNTLPNKELDEYLEKIKQILNKKNYDKNGNIYSKNGLDVIINEYAEHPKNTYKFPENYKSVDIIIRSAGYDYSMLYERMWNLTNKMFRVPGTRENPTYINDAKELLNYLPAQIEMGCGPSISAGIPALYNMHETYRVQNHISKKFYFSDEDTLFSNILENPETTYKKFAQVPIKCITAQLTEGYKTFGKLYKDGYFKGVVYNNNFDRLIKRMDIPEKILRIYDLDDYIADVYFEKDVKSLISIGCHADRRQVEKQARENGLKVIYIDPEGFYNKEFEEYKVEAPKTGDLIWKTTFENAMEELSKIVYKN